MYFLDPITYKISLLVGIAMFIYLAREDWESVCKVGVMLLSAGFFAGILQFIFFTVLHPIMSISIGSNFVLRSAPYILLGFFQLSAFILFIKWYSKRNSKK